MSEINHIMLDLETLGTSSQAPVVAIGAVHFTRERGILNTLEAIVDMGDAVRHGEPDGSTIAWWMNQSRYARYVLTSGRLPLHRALESLNTAISEWCDQDSGRSTARVWGNGSDFDISIILNAYRSVNLVPNWRFYNHRCYRTIARQYPDIKRENNPKKHDAVADAKCQAEHLLRIAGHKGLTLL